MVECEQQRVRATPESDSDPEGAEEVFFIDRDPDHSRSLLMTEEVAGGRGDCARMCPGD
jgi:hypothetical protein